MSAFFGVLGGLALGYTVAGWVFFGQAGARRIAGAVVLALLVIGLAGVVAFFPAKTAVVGGVMGGVLLAALVGMCRGKLLIWLGEKKLDYAAGAVMSLIAGLVVIGQSSPVVPVAAAVPVNPAAVAAVPVPAVAVSADCGCDKGAICTGPRGGKYCLTAGGNKKYL